jgi:serine/threonine protein kinase
MHAKEYVHLDIKLDNILLDEFFNIKLADFGIALCAKGTSKHIAHKRGTRKYMAPEVEAVNEKAPFQVFRADIYSLGVCLHIMLLGVYPNTRDAEDKSTENPEDFKFSDLKSMKQEDSDMDVDPEIFDESILSQECKELIEWMLHPNPKKRPTVEQIFEHPWMNRCFDHKITEVVYFEMKERSEYLKSLNERQTASLSLDLD